MNFWPILWPILGRNRVQKTRFVFVWFYYFLAIIWVYLFWPSSIFRMFSKNSKKWIKRKFSCKELKIWRCLICIRLVLSRFTFVQKTGIWSTRMIQQKSPVFLRIPRSKDSIGWKANFMLANFRLPRKFSREFVGNCSLFFEWSFFPGKNCKKFFQKIEKLTGRP